MSCDIVWSHVKPEVHSIVVGKQVFFPSPKNASAHTTIPSPILAMSIDNPLNPVRLAEDALSPMSF